MWGGAYGGSNRAGHIAELGLNAEPFTIEIMAAVAAQERRLISRRAKGAAAKARGVKLGRYRHDGSISKAEALDRAEALRSTFEELRALSHRCGQGSSTSAA